MINEPAKLAAELACSRASKIRASANLHPKTGLKRSIARQEPPESDNAARLLIARAPIKFSDELCRGSERAGGLVPRSRHRFSRNLLSLVRGIEVYVYSQSNWQQRTRGSARVSRVLRRGYLLIHEWGVVCRYRSVNLKICMVNTV